jgi:hypothetical protein
MGVSTKEHAITTTMYYHLLSHQIYTSPGVNSAALMKALQRHKKLGIYQSSPPDVVPFPFPCDPGPEQSNSLHTINY